MLDKMYIWVTPLLYAFSNSFLALVLHPIPMDTIANHHLFMAQMAYGSASASKVGGIACIVPVKTAGVTTIPRVNFESLSQSVIE
jgi:hypothetical protein